MLPTARKVHARSSACVSWLQAQIGKVVASLVMDSVHPLHAMIVIMLLVATFNALFTLGTSLTSLAAIWCLGRIVHVRRCCRPLLEPWVLSLQCIT